jgi:hypothetical protein
MTGKHRRRLNKIRYARQHHCALRDVRALQAMDRFRRKVRYDDEGRLVLDTSVTIPANVTLVLREGLTLTHAGYLVLEGGVVGAYTPPYVGNAEVSWGVSPLKRHLHDWLRRTSPECPRGEGESDGL